MDLYAFLDLCDQWSRLGGSVQEQATDVLRWNEPLEDQNPTALKEIATFLRDVGSNGIDVQTHLDAIESYLKELA